MKLYPNYYCKRVTDLSAQFLKSHNIKGLILDVDNTLIDYDKNLLEGVKDWYKEIKENNIKCIILSNSHRLKKVKAVAETIEIPYIFFGTKPLKRGFNRAQKELNIQKENIAVVGDQIFTDVIGANRLNMFSILVEPVAEKDIFITKIKRPIEEMIIKKYLKEQERKKHNSAVRIEDAVDKEKERDDR